jgi:hypothetical protein
MARLNRNYNMAADVVFEVDRLIECLTEVQVKPRQLQTSKISESKTTG